MRREAAVNNIYRSTSCFLDLQYLGVKILRAFSPEKHMSNIRKLLRLFAAYSSEVSDAVQAPKSAVWESLVL